MSNFLTANRVAAVATWLAGLGALILAVIGTFPQSWQNTALGVAGLLTKAAVATKFLDGASRFEIHGGPQAPAQAALEQGPSPADLLAENGTPAEQITAAGAPEVAA